MWGWLLGGLLGRLPGCSLRPLLAGRWKLTRSRRLRATQLSAAAFGLVVQRGLFVALRLALRLLLSPALLPTLRRLLPATLGLPLRRLLTAALRLPLRRLLTAALRLAL